MGSTSQASYLSYGDNTGLIKEYGNLAFASIIIGDGNGNTSIKRAPLFIYYKLFNATTNKEIASDHTLDVFGVGPRVSAANDFIDSPLNYYIPRSGYTVALNWQHLIAVILAAQALTSPVCLLLG